MKIAPDNAQHIGARKEQQDAFGFSDLEQSALTRKIGALSVVADGMGGMEQGQEMSRLACRTMIETYTQQPDGESIPDALSHALDAANRRVLERARQLGLLGETGTTLSAAVIHDDGLHWTSVGDSRIYLYRDGMLTQLTLDHGYARHLDQKVAAGEISPQAAAEDPKRHAITSFLGLDALEEIDRTVRPFPLQPGDRILLCTDGLHGVLTDEEIGEILESHPSGAAQALIDAALAKRRKNQDNVTATLFDYLPNGAPAQPTSRITSVPATLFRRNRRGVRVKHLLGGALLLMVLLGAGIAVTSRNSEVGGGLVNGASRVIAAVWERLPPGRSVPADEPVPVIDETMEAEGREEVVPQIPDFQDDPGRGGGLEETERPAETPPPPAPEPAPEEDPAATDGEQLPRETRVVEPEASQPPQPETTPTVDPASQQQGGSWLQWLRRFWPGSAPGAGQQTEPKKAAADPLGESVEP
jgi:PPM family protein phosphatase